MKNIVVLIGLLSGILKAYGQDINYHLDLSRVKRNVKTGHLQMGHPGPSGREIEVNSLYMTIGGKPVVPVMGEFHYGRYDYRYWRETLLKMKASGVNIVSTYALWIYHEEQEGQVDWTGNNNLRQFIKTCQEVGLLVHLRIGPYCNAECRNGGLPDWLMAMKNVRKRYNDPVYLNYVRRWYKALFDQVNGFLYKEGGPVMGIQLENEYVTSGHVVPHLTELKKLAVEVGFDVPVYSMTHWMSTDYPKGELIPYAGYYIETPWTAGLDELPVSNFQFFSYNRISDNIGTDLIKIDGEVQSLNSQDMDSPYFTCEVGLGTPTFYGRRPIVPQKMAGANINLRLGCGVNLMGYYMYSGGSHKVGELNTLQSPAGKVSYDYQAPLREFGTMGTVMQETRKYNYLMNDFGEQLAPAVAYLPTSNNDTSNLQWAVRMHENQGFLFCSNYLYKHSRKAFKNVQFSVELNRETMVIPRKPVTITNEAYFTWPFNMKLDQVTIKYATVQPICQIEKDNYKTCFFFEDDEIAAEYFFDKEHVKNVTVSDGSVRKEKDGYFVSGLKPGIDCVINVEPKKGIPVRMVTLTEKQSDQIWKFSLAGQSYVAITKSGLFVDDNQLTLFDEAPGQEILVYPSLNAENGTSEGIFTRYSFSEEPKSHPVQVVSYRPMQKASWIEAVAGKEMCTITRVMDNRSLSGVQDAILRCAASGKIMVRINGQPVQLNQKRDYLMADLKGVFVNGLNTLEISAPYTSIQVIAEVEAFFANGERRVWNTDDTWLLNNQAKPVKLLGSQGEGELPVFNWDQEEALAMYEIKLPENIPAGPEEWRLSIEFTGNRADAFLGQKLIHDYLFDGDPWIIGINRFTDQLQGNPLLIRIKAFPDAHPPVYFERDVDTKGLDKASLNKVELIPEYRFYIKMKND